MSAPTGLCSKMNPARWCKKKPKADPPAAVVVPEKPDTIIGDTIENATLPLQHYLAGLSGHWSQNPIVIAKRMSVWLLGTVLGGAGAELYLSSGTLTLKKPQQALLLQQAEVKKTTQDGGEGGDEAKAGVDGKK